MRLRTFATAAILGAALLPPSLADAVPPANVTVERAQLRTLMLQRHALVQQLAAADGARGQLLTLNALVAADAILSADAAALEHTIKRLTPRPATRHAIRRKARPRVKRAAVHTHTRAVMVATPALLAAPGVLWSPSARAMTIGLPATLATPDPTPARRVPARVSVPHPLNGLGDFPTFSTTPLLDTATLSSRPAVAVNARVPQALSSSLSGTSAHAPAPRRVATGRAPSRRLGNARAVDVPLAPPDAPSHGRLALEGASGALAIAAANARVAAAVLTPVPTPAAARTPVRHVRHKVRRRASARHATPDPAAQLPGLLRRWRLVTRALGRVRALEQWARANAPAAAITANDVVASPDVLRRRLDRWTARPTLDAPIAPQPPSSGASVAAPSSLLGATLALTGSGGMARASDEAVSGAIAISATTGIVSSTITDNPVSPTAPLSVSAAMSGTTAAAALVSPTVALTGSPSIVEQPISLTAAAALTADVSLSSTATVTPGLPALDATPATPAAANGLSPVTPTLGMTASAALSVTTGTTETSGAAITATAPLTAAVPVSATAQPAGPATLSLSVRQGSPVLSVSGASSTDPLSLSVTLPVTAEGVLAPAGFESERGALESVLRQGQALYADLQAKAAGIEADYRARLRAVVALNAQIERGYYARYYAWQRWKLAAATYQQRQVTLNGFLRRRQAAKLARQEWQQREDAYVRALGAYNAARAQAPAAPISATDALSSTTTVSPTVSAAPAAPAAPEPAAPVPPGPEPPPFTEPMPPFPVPPGPAAPYPGLEPANYALPSPPDAVPPWDGASLPITPASLVIYGGIARGVNASGYEHVTQDTLLSEGALDGVPSYLDPIKGVITTYFGGSTVFQRFHPGLDIATAEYTPIRAAAAGRVVWAGLAVPGDDHASYGNCVIIKHNDHISTLYAHMDDQAHPLAVQIGDTVAQGQVIGYEGMTGWTTGPHLHFEVRVDNIQVDPLLLIPNPQN